MARQVQSTPKYIVKNGISFPRPGRPLTGPGSKDSVHIEPGPEPREIPAEYVAGYLKASPGRPADIELYVGQVSAVNLSGVNATLTDISPILDGASVVHEVVPEEPKA